MPLVQKSGILHQKTNLGRIDRAQYHRLLGDYPMVSATKVATQNNKAVTCQK